MNIQDEKDKIQLYIKNEIVGLDNYDKIVKRLDIGDIIGISGTLFRTRTDQLSINVTSIDLLSKSIRPLPNMKEKDGHMYFSFDDKETFKFYKLTFKTGFSMNKYINAIKKYYNHCKDKIDTFDPVKDEYLLKWLQLKENNCDCEANL